MLDLLKEGLLAPRTVVSLKEIPGLDAITAEPGGGLRIGSMVTLANLAVAPLVRHRYPALSDAVGSSASPQIRHVATLGGNLLQRPRCWYFRAVEHHCLRRGGDHCFAIAGENQYHAIFGNAYCAIVHPSTAATVLVALGATVELTNADGAGRRVLLEQFLVSPEQDIERENDLKPHEILTAYPPAEPAGTRMAHVKQGEKTRLTGHSPMSLSPWILRRRGAAGAPWSSWARLPRCLTAPRRLRPRLRVNASMKV